jgi:hypothetical protein
LLKSGHLRALHGRLDDLLAVDLPVKLLLLLELLALHAVLKLDDFGRVLHDGLALLGRSRTAHGQKRYREDCRRTWFSEEIIQHLFATVHIS